MEIIGTIKKIGYEEQYSATFSMVEVILDTSTIKQGTLERYENACKIQFCNSRISLLEGFETGERVRVYFDIKGREIQREGKTYFVQNLNAHKIERLV